LSNNTSQPATNIRLKARCLDRRGHTVRDAWGKPKIEVLMPQQEVDFEVMVYNVAFRSVEGYEVEVKYDFVEGLPAGEPLAGEPPTEEPAPAEGPEGVITTNLHGKKLYGHVFVMGTLRNNTSQPITNIRIKARCLDSRDRTVRDAWGKPRIEVLMPRQEVDFEIMVYNVTYRFVEAYGVEVRYDILEQ
jgi:hypothetical protein